MKISKKEGIDGVRLEHNKFLFWTIIFLLVVLIGLIIYVKIRIANENINLLNNSQIANPASVYCIANNGSLTIKNDENGGQYGVCTRDGKECEEWAYFRGECNFTLAINDSCQTDSDCVPASCCHSTSCTNKASKSVCNLLCTQECRPGTLDCGQASCVCNQGKCGVNVLK
jgi:putative hemolysin